MNITVLRREFGTDYTRGRMYIDNEFFGYTLEDALRVQKINGESAIPAGRYPLVLTYSPKYNKNLPEILGVPGFSGIRIHGGNNKDDTDGCILVADHVIGKDKIYGSLSDKLMKKTNPNTLHWIEIINC